MLSTLSFFIMENLITIFYEVHYMLKEEVKDLVVKEVDINSRFDLYPLVKQRLNLYCISMGLV